MTKRKINGALLFVSSILFATGCGTCVSKPTPAPAPPAPEVATPTPTPMPTPTPAPKPTLQFTAEPGTIERGQCATLRWSVTDATDISIAPGIGVVNASGDRQVCPADTTTYTLTASGPGGSGAATGIVNVTVPPPPTPTPTPEPTPVPKKTLSELLSIEVQDVYFDLNKSAIREDARAVLTHDAEALKQIFGDIPDAVVQIEGQCDERGSDKLNNGLGARRAAAAKDFLVQLGVPADKLKTISYGKERPVCTDTTEECYQKNRRDHFAAAQ